MNSIDQMMLAVIIFAISFISGYITGTADHSGKDSVMEQFKEWKLQDQQDFILAAISNKESLRREIAEDWCAINRQTQRVCWNARMKNPIRGVK